MEPEPRGLRMFLALLPERNPFGTVFRWFQSLRSYHHRLISSEASGSVADLDLLAIRTILLYYLLVGCTG